MRIWHVSEVVSSTVYFIDWWLLIIDYLSLIIDYLLIIDWWLVISSFPEGCCWVALQLCGVWSLSEMVMELLKLPPNLHFYPAKLKLNPQFLCRTTQRLSVQSALKKLRVRSEFNGKFNGALSGDTDPRLMDRVRCTSLSVPL